MIKEVTVVVVAFAMGFILYFQLQGVDIIPQITTTVTGITASLQSTIDSATSFLKKNPWLAPIFGTGAISITGFIAKRYQAMKTAKDDVTNQALMLQGQLNQTANAATQIKTENLQLEQKVEVLQKQVASVPAEIVTLQKQLAAKTEEIETLIHQKNTEVAVLQQTIEELKLTEKVIVK